MKFGRKAFMAEIDDIEKRVLDSAKELFLHYGFDKTTMNDIANKAGVAKSTIYTRWKKKDELFDTLIWRESKDYTEDWMQRVENDPDSGTYGGWMRHALTGFFENEFLRAIYRNDRRMIGGMLQRRGTEELFTRRIEMFMAFFKQMQDAGAVRKDIDPLTITYMMNSLQYGLIHFDELIPDSHTPDIKNVLLMMVDMMEQYITPENGGDREAGKQVLRQFMAQIRHMLAQFELNQ